MSGSNYKGVVGILTGGGDVPGLNPAIRAVTVRALQEGYRVLGIRRGWAGLVDPGPHDENIMPLDQETVSKAGRTGGTFLHTSRTRPSHVARVDVPAAMQSRYDQDMNDLTPEVLANLERLGIDVLVPIGGDDTLSYAVDLHGLGFKVIAVPKTMDNDVPGTDYCIGFSTCVTRTISMINDLRTSAGSHERLLVLEVFGRYAGFTALLPTMAGAANRCVIPESPCDLDRLTELLVEDRRRNPSSYAVVLVSEGATFEGTNMVFQGAETDAYGHKRLGGVGDLVADEIKARAPRFNDGQRVNVTMQRLGYLVRCGSPDFIDSIVPTAFGNLVMELTLRKEFGRLVCVRDGRYDHVPLDVVTQSKKLVDVAAHYDTERLRPRYEKFSGRPLMIMG